MDPIPPATTPDPATIVYDEREELLREAAALGNSKAVTHYLQAGVNANGRNKINGWTSLHWAASRGHLPIVHLLLRHGADPAVLNFKKQTALDLAKADPIRECLEERTPAAAVATGTPKAASNGDAAAKPGSKADATPKLAITANYLREPDLLKTWSSPEELPTQLKPTVLTEADRPVSRAPSQPATAPSAAAATSTPPAHSTNVNVAQPPAQHSDSSKLAAFTPHSPNLIRFAIMAATQFPAPSIPTSRLNVIGHVLARPSAALADLVLQIQDELLQDDNAPAFAHLYPPGFGSGRLRVSRLLTPVPKTLHGVEGFMPVPKTQWSKYTVGEVVLAEVKEGGCAWALLVAEVEV